MVSRRGSWKDRNPVGHQQSFSLWGWESSPKLNPFSFTRISDRREHPAVLSQAGAWCSNVSLPSLHGDKQKSEIIWVRGCSSLWSQWLLPAQDRSWFEDVADGVFLLPSRKDCLLKPAWLSFGNDKQKQSSLRIQTVYFIFLDFCVMTQLTFSKDS